MVRVVGTDPGTSSLDLLLLVDGAVGDQARLTPEALRDDPGCARRDARAAGRRSTWSPGPSGYGLPLVRGERSDRARPRADVARPARRARARTSGVIGFRAWVRALVALGAAGRLPAGRDPPAHDPRPPQAERDRPGRRPTRSPSPRWRSGSIARGRGGGYDRIDLRGRRDRLGVLGGPGRRAGPARRRRAGTRGPIGLRSGGAWDGEVAYWRSPLSKDDLFRGGLLDLGPEGPDAFRESLTKHVAGLQAVTPFDRLYLSGAAADRPEIAALATEALGRFGRLAPLPSLARRLGQARRARRGAPRRRPGRRPTRRPRRPSLAAPRGRFGNRLRLPPAAAGRDIA